MNYDNWKLDNNESFTDVELFECESCNELFTEFEFEEVTYSDADGDRQTKFLCECCQEKAISGEL